MPIQTRIIERKQIARGVMKITCALDGAAFDWKPGQFAHVAVPELKYPDPRGPGRDFTICCLPNARNVITFTFRTGDAPSGFKQTLLSLPYGEKVLISGPFGGMPIRPEDAHRPLVFIAGGIGITAFRAKIRHALSESAARRVTLFWSAKDERTIPYMWEMRTLAQENKNRFTLVEAFGARINADMIKKRLRDVGAHPIWQIAGNPDMARSMREQIVGLGIPENDIQSEEYIGYGSQTKAELTDRPLVDVEQLAEAAHLNTSLYDGFLEAINKVVIVSQMDAEGNITFVNDTFVEVSGYSREELIGQNHRVIKSGFHSPEFYQDLWSTISSGKVWRGEIKNRAKDGSYWWADTSTAPVFDEDGLISGYVSVRFLITARKEAEQKLEEYHRGLEQAVKERTVAFTISNEALKTEMDRRNELEKELQKHADALAVADRRKDEFIAILSHELRNPLSQIVTTADIARLGLPVQCPVLIGHLDTIGRESHTMKRLLDDLLDVSRIMRGKITLHRERVDVAAIIRLIIENTRHKADVRHAFSIVLPDTLCVYADPVRVEQIFTNLVDNAVKYSPNGGTVSISARCEGTNVCVTVKDEGIGIDRENIGKIFGLFSQSDSTPLAAMTGGLGIGLFITQKLCEMHGGAIEVRSEGAGKGSEFTVTLPLPKAAAEEEVRLTHVLATEPSLTKDLRIMVIDDIKTLADSMGTLLSKMGYDARVGYSGSDAIALAREYKPDVILLDIGMPDMNGYEALRRLKTIPELSKTRFFAVTGFGQKHDRKLSTKAGFAAHLIKPLGARDLQQALEG